ncbi:MAG: lipoate--protein ligase family protein [Spirochaetales bacterium]|nr:lipoate--protein ligase family protein [Spirochaetales bacterium]
MSPDIPFSVFKSASHDPFINLSIEEYLLNHHIFDSNILFLYRNRPCVVIGRFQNPWKECRPDYLKKNNIPLLRRISGGGAVYHDKGNLNFSIITKKNNRQVDKYFNLVQECIARVGFKTECENKNSLLVAGYKVSGSAFRVTSKRCLHHGTLLVAANLPNLRRYLTPSFSHEQCRGGISSVRSNVENLNYFNTSVTMSGIIKIFSSVFSGKEGMKTGNILSVINYKDMKSYIVKNKSYEWIYGNTPECEIHLPLEIGENHRADCLMSLYKGRIRNIIVPGLPDFSEVLLASLRNIPFDLSIIEYTVKKMRKRNKYGKIPVALINNITTIEESR